MILGKIEATIGTVRGKIDSLHEIRQLFFFFNYYSVLIFFVFGGHYQLRFHTANQRSG
jgi:hypothetical protein